mgnify:FL=1|jgi:hypothetical protein
MHWVDGLGGGSRGVSMTPPRGMHRTPLRNASFLGVISGSVSGHVSTLFVPSLTGIGVQKWCRFLGENDAYFYRGKPMH